MNLHKLKRKQKDIDEEQRKIQLSISLRICPICDAKIISEETEILYKPKKYFFGLFKKYTKTWDHRNVCSKDKTHYEDKGWIY